MSCPCERDACRPVRPCRFLPSFLPPHTLPFLSTPTYHQFSAPAAASLPPPASCGLRPPPPPLPPVLVLLPCPRKQHLPRLKLLDSVLAAALTASLDAAALG
uniref:Uncharacterized protein n=1 Tax=Hordeum vulgare subsp. vulgare TaxID=112509 RepID=A0A8I6YQ61_HORVV